MDSAATFTAYEKLADLQAEHPVPFAVYFAMSPVAPGTERTASSCLALRHTSLMH